MSDSATCRQAVIKKNVDYWHLIITLRTGTHASGLRCRRGESVRWMPDNFLHTINDCRCHQMEIFRRCKKKGLRDVEIVCDFLNMECGGLEIWGVSTHILAYGLCVFKMQESESFALVKKNLNLAFYVS